jgi:hypothetical protein
VEAALQSSLGRRPLGPITISIGRATDNALTLNDPQTSSRHAEISPGHNDDTYQITDLGSTNGTFVNDQRLTPGLPCTLNPGDCIRIGSILFTYEVSSFPPTLYANQSQFPGYQTTVAALPPTTDQALSPQPSYPGYQQVNQTSAYTAQSNSPHYQTSIVTPSPMINPTTPYQQADQIPVDTGPIDSPGYQATVAALPPITDQALPPPPPPVYGTIPNPYTDPNPYSGVPRNNRVRWIILGSIVGFLVVCIGLIAIIYNNNLSTPAKTLDAFCNDLKNQDYLSAYNQYSSGLQFSITEDSFQQTFTGQTCTYSVGGPSGTRVTGELVFTAPNGSTGTYTVPLVLENNTWKIDAILYKWTKVAPPWNSRDQKVLAQLWL